MFLINMEANLDVIHPKLSVATTLHVWRYRSSDYSLFKASHFCGIYIRGRKWQSGIAIGDRVDLDFFFTRAYRWIHLDR